MNKDKLRQKRQRNKQATELFEKFLTAHCESCLRARRRKKRGWRPCMDSCPRCGYDTGQVFAAFLEVWRPEIVEYARTRDMRCLGASWDWEDLVSEFEMTLARSWYSGFTPGRGKLVHYMWRSVHNSWSHVISLAFLKKNTIKRAQAIGNTSRYTSGVPSARVCTPIDDDGGDSFENLLDPTQVEPSNALVNATLAAKVQDKILVRLNPLDQAVFWDLVVHKRLRPARFAEEHLMTLATVRQRMKCVIKRVAEVAEEYKDHFAP